MLDDDKNKKAAEQPADKQAAASADKADKPAAKAEKPAKSDKAKEAKSAPAKADKPKAGKADKAGAGKAEKADKADETAEETTAKATEEEFEVPDYVPLDKELPQVVQHFPMRANEAFRPVLPGTNTERKAWALRKFTARRILFIGAAACLVFYFFLLLNHMKLHRSYPVDHPVVMAYKAEVRQLGEWVDALGNQKVRPKDLVKLTESGVSGLDSLKSDKAKREALRLNDVIDELNDKELQSRLRDIDEMIESSATAPLDEVEAYALPQLAKGIDNLAVRKLVVLGMIDVWTQRRTDTVDEIRNLDQQLRMIYFRLADRKMPTAWLLLAACTLFVIAARMRWVYSPTIPAPEPDAQKGAEQDRVKHLSRWGVGLTVGAVTLGFVIAGWTLNTRPVDEAWEAVKDILNRKEKVVLTDEDFLASTHQFRGYNGNGSVLAGLPDALDKQWEITLGVDGIAQPVVFKKDLIIAAADSKTRKLYVLDAASGKMKHDVSLAKKAGNPKDVYKDDTWGETMYAACTPTTDGKRAYALFVNGDVHAVDLESGREDWAVNLGIPEIQYGHAQSPILYRGDEKNILIVPMVHGGDKSGVYGLNPNDGSQEWFAPVEESSWASPLLMTEGDADLLVVPGFTVMAFDPITGAKKWSVGNLESENGASPVVVGDMIVAALAGNGAWGIAQDGSVTWELNNSAKFLPANAAPVADGERFWTLTQKGEIARWTAGDGKVEAHAKVDGSFWASPVLAGGRMVVASTSGKVSIVDAVSLKVIGEADVGGEVFVTPAVTPEQIIVRAMKGKIVSYANGADIPEGPIDFSGAPTAVADAGQKEETTEQDPFLLKPAEGATDTFEKVDLSGNWPGFRGPDQQGVAPEGTELPVTWNEETGENIAWKVDLPLPGFSSPIVWNGKIFLTSSDGTRQIVSAYAVADGKELWTTDIPTREGKGLPKVYTTKRAARNYMYAAPTPFTDGKRVYALFANGDLAALDEMGQLLWVRDLGLPDNAWGHSQSLNMYEGRLLVAWDQKRSDGAIYAFGGATGKEIYRIPRNNGPSFATPYVVHTRYGQQMITIADQVIAYNPASGDEIWRAGRFNGDVGPTPIFTQEKVYATMKVKKRKGELYGGIWALRTNGKGDVTDSAVAWMNQDKPMDDMASAISNGWRIWTVAGSKGVLTNFESQSGDIKYSEELGATHWASPILVGKRMLFLALDGTSRWVGTGDSFGFDEGGKLIGELPPAEEGGRPIMIQHGATPAVYQNQLIIRNDYRLFCIKEAP